MSSIALSPLIKGDIPWSDGWNESSYESLLERHSCLPLQIYLPILSLSEGLESETDESRTSSYEKEESESETESNVYAKSCDSTSLDTSLMHCSDSILDGSTQYTWSSLSMDSVNDPILSQCSSDMREVEKPKDNEVKSFYNHRDDCYLTSDDIYTEEDISIQSSSTKQQNSCYKQSIHLWQFLHELLQQPAYRSCIFWLDQNKGIFKIKDSTQIARLWGKRKNKPAMNYDKLSRSIRQYYKKGIIQKTPSSKRLVYQFCAEYLRL